MFYLMMHWTHFYLLLYVIKNMVMDLTEKEKWAAGNLTDWVNDDLCYTSYTEQVEREIAQLVH